VNDRAGRLSSAFAIALLVAATTSLPAQTPGETTVQPVPGTEVVLALSFVPPGSFLLGSAADEVGRNDDEGPARRVRLQGFWMTVHEITHTQFSPFRFVQFDAPVAALDDLPFDIDAVTRPSPPYEDPSHGMQKDDHPVTGMTRLSALYYARWLSNKTGRLFRLPTEAEWEYACRAGTEGAFGFGSDDDSTDEYAWFEANSSGSYHPVGSKAPNAWGLHDMHGNVAEWVIDGYDADAYTSLPDDDVPDSPLLGPAGKGRGVVRGGAFDDEPARMRCAERLPEAVAWKARDPQMPKSQWWNTDSPHVGFRLVSPVTQWTPVQIREYWAELLGG